MNADRWLADTRTSYDTVAVSYADQLREALAGAPYLRAALALFADFRRVLRPGGPLLLGFHVGNESRLKTQGYGGHPMNVPVHRRQPDQVAGWLRDAGFTVEAHLLIDSTPTRAFQVRSSSHAVSPSHASWPVAADGTAKSDHIN